MAVLHTTGSLLTFDSELSADPGTMAECVSHLRKLSLKKLIIRSIHSLPPSDIAALLVGGLGQNGTLEELVIEVCFTETQVG